MSVVLRELGRNEEAEEEMKRAGECAKKLDSWKAPIEILETSERDKEWMDVSGSPPAEPGQFRF